MNIACRLAVTQPGALVTLIRCRLLSVVALREMLGMAPVAETGTDMARLMGHDAYRRVSGRLVQARWGA